MRPQERSTCLHGRRAAVKLRANAEHLEAGRGDYGPADRTAARVVGGFDVGLYRVYLHMRSSKTPGGPARDRTAASGAFCLYSWKMAPAYAGAPVHG